MCFVDRGPTGFCSLLLASIAFNCEVQAQSDSKPAYVLESSVFYGSIIRHNPDITHLITAHPEGFLLGVNRKRYGEESWEAAYNYPDTGFTFIYQNMNNPTLGEHFGLYAHYNFYFSQETIATAHRTGDCLQHQPL